MSGVTTTRFILRALRVLGEASFDILIAPFFPKQYPFTASGRKLFGLDPPAMRPAKRSVSALLARLRRQGFVVRVAQGKRTVWRLSPAGEQHLRELEIERSVLPPSDGKLRIVSFDVPERERRKRDWLRRTLRSCDYRMVQKSVWAGERPLPDWFLRGAEAAGVIDCLDVFSIAQKGTLRGGR